MVSLDDETEGALEEKRVNIYDNYVIHCKTGFLSFPGQKADQSVSQD